MEILRRHQVSDRELNQAREIRDRLNELIQIDSRGINNILRISVPCDADLSYFAVVNEIKTESGDCRMFSLSVLGLINALVISPHLAITYNGERFGLAVRDSHPDNVQVIE